MKIRRVLVSSLCAVSLVSLSACVTDPNTGQQKVSRTAIGAGGGALTSALVPVTNPDRPYWEQKREQVLAGSGLGAG